MEALEHLCFDRMSLRRATIENDSRTDFSALIRLHLGDLDDCNPNTPYSFPS